MSAIKGARTERPVNPMEKTLGAHEMPFLPHGSCCHRVHMKRCDWLCAREDVVLFFSPLTNARLLSVSPTIGTVRFSSRLRQVL